MLKHVLIAKKDDIKYKTFSDDGVPIKILGIGEKAIKYRVHGDPDVEFVYHDSPEGHAIARGILTQLDKSIDLYPACETHNFRYYETCDCAICANFKYCF